jgi:hypothetical protein
MAIIWFDYTYPGDGELARIGIDECYLSPLPPLEPPPYTQEEIDNLADPAWNVEGIGRREWER